MRCTAAVVALGLVGCGRIAFDPLASSDGGGSGDAAIDGVTACAAFGPWGAPVPLTGPNSPQDEWGAATSPNGLELMFHSNRSGTTDLFVATRSTTADAFGAATAVGVLNSGSADESPTFSPDGLTLYFSSNRSGGASKLFRTHRSSLAAAWDAPALVPELTNFGVQGPSMSKRGDELFDNTTGNPTRLGAAAFDRTTFSTPFVIGELDVNMPTGYPGLSPDGLTLVFEGTRASGDLILFSTRTSIGGTWSPEQTFTEASDSFVSQDPEFSFDGTELYWASNRATGGGTFDLFVMTRGCL